MGVERESVKLETLYTDWLLSLYNSQSSNTVKMYKKRLFDILSGLKALGVETVGDLQEQAGKELLYHALPKHSPHVVKQSRAAWENFRRFAEEVKGVLLPPIPNRNLPKVKERAPKPISKEELEKLLSYLREKEDRDIYLAVLLMASAGLRAAEVLSLSKFSFEERGDQLWVRVKGKGGKERVVPLPVEVSREIKESLNSFPLFKNSQRYLTLYRKVKKAGKSVGIEGLTPHRLRHTFGTLLMQRGVPLRVVQELMGHSSPTTTAGYLKVADEEKVRAIRSLEDLSS